MRASDIHIGCQYRDTALNRTVTVIGINTGWEYDLIHVQWTEGSNVLTKYVRSEVLEPLPLEAQIMPIDKNIDDYTVGDPELIFDIRLHDLAVVRINGAKFAGVVFTKLAQVPIGSLLEVVDRNADGVVILREYRKNPPTLTDEVKNG